MAFSVNPINQPFFFSNLQIGGRGQPRDSLWCHLVSEWVLKSSSPPMSEKTSDSLSSGPNASTDRQLRIVFTSAHVPGFLKVALFMKFSHLLHTFVLEAKNETFFY